MTFPTPCLIPKRWMGLRDQSTVGCFPEFSFSFFRGSGAYNNNNNNIFFYKLVSIAVLFGTLWPVFDAPLLPAASLTPLTNDANWSAGPLDGPISGFSQSSPKRSWGLHFSLIFTSLRNYPTSESVAKQFYTFPLEPVTFESMHENYNGVDEYAICEQ